MVTFLIDKDNPTRDENLSITKESKKVSAELPGPGTVAGINATVLSILVAVVSAYAIYTYSVVQEMEQQTLREAERINQVHFVRSKYLPIDDELQEFQLPSDPEDMKDLQGRLVPYLWTLMGKSSPSEHYPTYMNIPEDPAERGERILQIINIISHRYPFPKAIEREGSGWSKFSPEPLYFTDLDSVRQWLSDTEKLLSPMRLILLDFQSPGSSLESLNNYFEALVERKKEEIKIWKTNPAYRVGGHINPFYLFNDFTNNLVKVQGIADSAKYYLDRTERLEETRPNPWTVATSLIVGGIVFALGVIYPLVFPLARKKIYLYVPTVFYAAVLLCVILKVLNIL